MSSHISQIGHRQSRRLGRLVIALAATGLITVSVATCMILIALQDRESPPASRLGAPLIYETGTRLPDALWNQISDALPARRHQVQIARAHLNDSDKAALIVVPAPKRFDVHVPSFEPIVLTEQFGLWQATPVQANCRPIRLGAFATAGWQDMRCLDGTILRIEGGTYRPG